MSVRIVCEATQGRELKKFNEWWDTLDFNMRSDIYHFLNPLIYIAHCQHEFTELKDRMDVKCCKKCGELLITEFIKEKEINNAKH